MDINATLIGEVIAFLIMVTLTVKFVWPPLTSAIEERQRRIAEGLEAADRARKELAAADDKAAEEVKNARAEAAGIIERANQQAAKILGREVDASTHKALLDELVSGI